MSITQLVKIFSIKMSEDRTGHNRELVKFALDCFELGMNYIIFRVKYPLVDIYSLKFSSFLNLVLN